MKSKDEIIDALQIHMFSPDCKGCAYLTESNNHTHLCTETMVNDVINTLSKSDLEVMKEILSRSEETQVENYVAMSGNIVLRIPLELCVRFDEEGNIL